MKYKLLYLFSMIILLSSFAYADLLTDNQAYWTFDNTLQDIANNTYNMTNNGATYTASGKINGAYDYETTEGDYMYSPAISQPNDEFSYNGWFKFENNNVNQLLIKWGEYTTYAAGERISSMNMDGAGSIYADIYLEGGSTLNRNTITFTPTVENWYMITVVVNSSETATNRIKIYINGQDYNATVSIDNSVTNIEDGARPFVIGRQRSGLERYFDGEADEVSLWLRALTDSEVLELYNSGNGSQYPYSPPPPTYSYHKVKITNIWNASNMAGVNVTLNNSLSNLTQSDGIAYFSNLSGSYDFIAKRSGFFNVTGTALENQTVIYNMTQSEINITVKELFSNTTITNFSINISGDIVINTTGNYGIIYPNSDNYTGYVIDNTGNDEYHTTGNPFEVLPLDNKTIILYVHQHDINITAWDAVTNTSINNFSLTVYDLNLSTSREFNTTSGYISVPVIHNSYNLTIHNATGYDTTNKSQVVDITGDTNVTFYLYEANSISFTIYDLDTLTLTNVTIDIELKGSTVTYNINATNGTAYINNLNIDTYQITLTGSGYDPTILFATISGGEHLDITAYMADNDIVDFVVQDQTGELLGNVIITFQQLVNGSYVNIGQVETDFSGRASQYLDPTVRYNFFAVKSGYETFTGEVLPTQDEYTVIMQELGADRFVSIFEDLKIQTYFTYTPLSGYAIATLALNSPSGSLSYYGMNSTYNSVNHFTNVTGFPAGTIVTLNITNISVTNFPTVTVFYWLKYTNRNTQYWNATYLLNDIIPVNITIEDGLFDDLEALDPTNPIRGLIGAFIILALCMLFTFSISVTSGKTLTVTAIGGMVGLYINWKFALMPKPLLIVALSVIGIMIIADNIGGGS